MHSKIPPIERKNLANSIITNPLWVEMHDQIENYFIHEMVNLEIDDIERYRCAIAVDTVRELRRKLQEAILSGNEEELRLKKLAPKKAKELT